MGTQRHGDTETPPRIPPLTQAVCPQQRTRTGRWHPCRWPSLFPGRRPPCPECGPGVSWGHRAARRSGPGCLQGQTVCWGRQRGRSHSSAVPRSSGSEPHRRGAAGSVGLSPSPLPRSDVPVRKRTARVTSTPLIFGLNLRAEREVGLGLALCRTGAPSRLRARCRGRSRRTARLLPALSCRRFAPLVPCEPAASPPPLFMQEGQFPQEISRRCSPRNRSPARGDVARRVQGSRTRPGRARQGAPVWQSLEQTGAPRGCGIGQGDVYAAGDPDSEPRRGPSQPPGVGTEPGHRVYTRGDLAARTPNPRSPPAAAVGPHGILRRDGDHPPSPPAPPLLPPLPRPAGPPTRRAGAAPRGCWVPAAVNGPERWGSGSAPSICSTGPHPSLDPT